MITTFLIACKTHKQLTFLLGQEFRKVPKIMKKSNRLLSLALSMCMVATPVFATPIFAEDHAQTSDSANNQEATINDVQFVKNAADKHFVLDKNTGVITSTFTVKNNLKKDLVYTLVCEASPATPFTITASDKVAVETDTTVDVKASAEDTNNESSATTKSVSLTIPHDKIPAGSKVTVTFNTKDIDFAKTTLTLKAGIHLQGEEGQQLINETLTPDQDHKFSFSTNWDQANSVWTLDILPPMEYIKGNIATQTPADGTKESVKIIQETEKVEDSTTSEQTTTEFDFIHEDDQMDAPLALNPEVAKDENISLITVETKPSAFEELTSLTLGQTQIDLTKANLSQIDLTNISLEDLDINQFNELASKQGLFDQGVMYLKSPEGYQLFVRDSALENFSNTDTIRAVFSVKRDAGKVDITTTALNQDVHSKETFTIETAEMPYTPGNPNDVTFKASHDYSHEAQTWTVKITLSDRPSEFVLGFDQVEGSALQKPTSFTIDGVAINPDVKTSMSGSKLKSATVTLTEEQLNKVKKDSLVQLVFPIDGSKAQSEKIQMDVNTGNMKKSLSARFSVKAGTPHTSTETNMWSMVGLLVGALVVLGAVFFARKRITKK